MEHNKGKNTSHYPLSPELWYTPMCEEFKYWNGKLAPDKSHLELSDSAK